MDGTSVGFISHISNASTDLPNQLLSQLSTSEDRKSWTSPCKGKVLLQIFKDSYCWSKFTQMSTFATILGLVCVCSFKNVETQYNGDNDRAGHDVWQEASQQLPVTRDDLPKSTKGRDYVKAAITSHYDLQLRDDLDQIDELLENTRKLFDLFEDHKSNLDGDSLFTLINEMYNELLEKYPLSPRAIFGKARMLEEFSNHNPNKELLKEATDSYKKILEMHDVPERLYYLAAERAYEMLLYQQNYEEATHLLSTLVIRYPDDNHLKTSYGIALILNENFVDAKNLFKELVTTNPRNHVFKTYV